MCGIAGLLYADPSRGVDPAVLKAMADSLAHRGPDADGYWVGSGVGLAHRRLSIIDLAGGDQPIGNEDDSIQVVLNGEVYNFEALRRMLESRGHRFRTRSDTEVIVHLYEEHGDRLVEHLRGMFAFALWDQNHRRLLLARDRLGIKPLYVYRDTEKLLFGSELKAILAHPEVPRSVDLQGLEEYLAFGMIPRSRTIFRGVEKLLPAHTLTVEPGALDRSARSYWRLNFEPDDETTLDQWAEAVRTKVEEAVRIHLVADVPVGAFLSGGLDSSAVVAAAAGGAATRLETFSIGFLEAGFSELPHASRVAECFGTQHHEEVVTADAASLLDELAYYYDEPFADSSALPTMLVSKVASGRVKVVLSGDGGDEAFGGYSRYAHDLKEAAVRQRLPGWFRRIVLASLARAYPKADWLPRPLRAKIALTNLALDAGSAYANTVMMCRPALRQRLLASPIGGTPELLVRECFSAAPGDNPLQGMLAVDLATFLPDDFLVKVDRASMAHGLEVRPPLLDHELMELAARIPSRWKVHRGSTKWIFKRAFEGVLPEGLAHRRKQGFEIPIDLWLRGPLREQFEALVLDARSPIGDLIDQNEARFLYQSHHTGYGRHGSILWSLLVLARWAERYLGNPSLSVASPPRGRSEFSR